MILKQKTNLKFLFAILSPRDIPNMKVKFDAIDYVDKLWVKYYSIEDAFRQVLFFFKEHKEYTHLIINTDDAAPEYIHLRKLIADVVKYDFPVISGCCTIDVLAGDMFLNVALEPLVNEEYRLIKKTNQPNFIESWQPNTSDLMTSQGRGMFKVVPNEFRKLNGIIRCWFEGHTLVVIRRDIVEKVGLLWNHNDEKLPPWTRFGDLGFALQCQLRNVPQYVDLRVYLLHRKYPKNTPPFNILVGNREPYTQFVKATKEIGVSLPEVEPSKMIDEIPREYYELMDYYYNDGPIPSLINKKILLFTPFCNESHSLTKYINSLLKIDYPKKLIDIFWVENSSEDNTWELLQEKKQEIEHLYRSFTLIKVNGGFTLPKVLLADTCGTGGKVASGTSEQIKKTRVNLQISIWNYAMSFFDDQDYMLFYFADVVVQPSIIKKYIEDLENHSDCGWVGGVMHKRFPHHVVAPDGSTLYDGLSCPFFELQDDDPIPKYHKRLGGYRYQYMIRDYFAQYDKISGFFDKYCARFPRNVFPYRYGYYVPMEQEIIDLQNIGDGVHECVTTFHVWMLRSEIIRLGLKFYVAPHDSTFAFEHDMHKYRYKMYVDTNVYLKHISVDGNIYRTGVETEYSEPIKPSLTEILKQEKEEREVKKSLEIELERRKKELERRQGPHP
jgi:hypothetical protein